MTLSQILKTAKIPLKEAEYLLGFLLKCQHEFLLTHLELVVEPSICRKYKILEKKRLDNWSIAVLIGQKEFYALNFKVDRNVLVPRPETELMVEEIIRLSLKNNEPAMIIDLGTGSGAIIISCAHEISKLNSDLYKKSTFKALDISGSALKIAKENAKLNKQNRKINFLKGNLLEPLVNKRNFLSLYQQRLIIAANLPYLTKAQIKLAPSIHKEPELALVAGRDGLKYYRELFKQLKSLKLRATILCEIDDSQYKSITVLAQKFFPLGKIIIKKDLANKRRLAIIET